MTKKFEGKKLLVLGSNVGSIDIVKYARCEGAYTIVADYLPPEKSPAKVVANEHWLISTTDINTLYEKCIEYHIDGIFAGVSEINLISSMQLSEMLGLRFYCNKEQWDLIENKASFRTLCEKFSVPCPHTYYTGGMLEDKQYATINYPVVLKPVDGSSSIGVVICNDESELRISIQDSITKSATGKVIIEEYFDGDEFSAHYTISDGKISFSCIDNRYPIMVNEGYVTSIPVARIYPSSFIESYSSQVNKRVIEMIDSLNLNTGVLFVQGLYDKHQDKFVIFEAGLRSAGEAPYRFINHINGINYMENIIDYILLGHGVIDLAKDDPFFHGNYCALISIVTKGGTIGYMSNIEDILAQYKDIVDYECRYKVGDATPSGNTLRQIMIRFAIIGRSIDELKHIIRDMNERVVVLDIEGNNMCLKFNVDNLDN